MKHFPSLALTGVSLLFLFFQSAFSASLNQLPVFKNDEHNEFFRLLSPDEQHWIMTLAVWYYDVNDVEISPLPVVPGPGEPKREWDWGVSAPGIGNNKTDIPEKLVFHFLNGDVPKHFQKEFTKWLATTFDLKKKHFDQFRAKGVFCTSSDSCELENLGNVGGICCPFG